MLAATSHAATFTVSTGADATSPGGCQPGSCTLRDAVEAANTAVGEDTIDFGSGVASAQLDTPLPAATEGLTINGGGKAVIGSNDYQSACQSIGGAFSSQDAVLRLIALPVRGVCGRAVVSSIPAPSISIGPRRADGQVMIGGTGTLGTIELFRAESGAIGGEASETYASGIVSNGSWSYAPTSEPAAGQRFTAMLTAPTGVSSNFSAVATTPADLTSPEFVRAVGISNSSVRLDFNEPVSGSIAGRGDAFSLNMGGVQRVISAVDVSGNSVFLSSVAMPWGTGEAGVISFTGSGRVTDLTGNELLNRPPAIVLAGPGELYPPKFTRARFTIKKICQKKVKKKCTKRLSTYLQFTLDKPARVVFDVVRAGSGKFVARLVRKLPAGSSKLKFTGRLAGKTLPAMKLAMRITGEDAARNVSAPLDVPFQVVTRNSRLR